ncbi:MAG TPA: hypothetical protein VJM15_02100 [Sphingomicrobium sp.]|nr:hypothetical protein [Sphingomicrobium sp.]
MNPDDETGTGRRISPLLIAVLTGTAILLVLLWFFSTDRDPDQDKLGDNVVVAAPAEQPETRCGENATFDLLKRELFRQAAERRGSDHAVFDQIARAAFVRMEHAVMESEDRGAGTVNCSGSLLLDLPPGIAVQGGRRTLSGNVDYVLESDGRVTVRNGDGIIAALATLNRVVEPPAAVPGETAAEANVAASESAAVAPGPPSSYPGRPSFDCARANTRGEIAVCSDSGLAALDLNMTTQYRRALTTASPAQMQLLRAGRERFLAYRDRCPDRTCIADAYLGRMREIRDIMEGRLQQLR